MGKNKFKDYLSVFAYKFFKYIVNILPNFLIKLLAKLIAKLAYLLTKKRKKIALANLKRALNLDEKSAKQILKDVYQNLSYNFMEFLQQDKLSQQQLLELISFVDTEYLDQALAAGKGVIIYTAHFGNWELLGAALTARGYQVNAIARKQNNSFFDREINQIRQNSSLKIIPKGLAVRQVFKALKKNEIVVILGDQDARQSGWKLDFFSRPASTYSGAVQFANKTGSPIVPAFLRRLGWLEHQFKFYPAHSLSNLSEADLKQELQDLLAISEAEIKDRPANWMWLHRRWKTFN